MPKISVGRGEDLEKKYGMKGTGAIGKHLVGENEEAHAANTIHFDLATPHVMGVFGKRGTGKCLLPDENILTDKGLTQARELFLKAREKGTDEINEENEQLFHFNGPQVQSVSEDYTIDKNQIVAAYRKKVNERLLKIETKSGREITVTKEHPLFALEGWKESSELEEGERVGVPRKTELAGKNQELSVPENFRETEFDSLNQRESQLLSSEDESIRSLADGSGSFHGMVEKAESKGLVDIKDGQVSVTQQGMTELEKRKTEHHYRRGKATPIKLPEKVTPELAEFMAYLIAEGHEQKISQNNYRIIFTNKNEGVLERFESLGEEIFDLEFRNMDQSSIYANSQALEDFLHENGYETGQNSFGKDIPGFLVSAEEETVSRFLSTYYDCEGNVTDQQIELSSASKDIAEAVNYMLLKFGILGRTTQKEKYASNTEEQKVRTYYQVTVSGGKQLKKFKEKIGFSISRKSEKLEEIIKESNTNIDTILCGKEVKKCRELMGADRPQVAKHKQSLKLYEEGEYAFGRDKLAEVAEKLGSQLSKIKRLQKQVKEDPSADTVEKFIDESGILWKEMNSELGYSRSDKRFLSYKKYRKNPEKLSKAALQLFEEKHDLKEAEQMLSKIEQLSESNLYWDEIDSIQEINYEGWVYDVTVEEDHSFTAGFGGILCHNSYSLGTIAEEIHDADISDNLSTIIVDPMGIYWSMKRPNDRAATLLEEWDIKPKGYDINIFIPDGKTESFEDDGMPYDKTFTLNPAELSATEWAMAFNIELNSKIGILLERIVTKLDDEFGDDYQLNTMIKALDKFDFDQDTRRALENRFQNAKDWGIFGEESTIEDFMTRGEISIIDMSVFGEMSSGWSVRSLVVGLLAKRVLRQRMAARRMEELNEMQGLSENEMPIVWMLIDEAHQFIPDKGRTPATKPLLRWVKIGREPGVSLALCTQQPNKLNSNALSQCDVILSHRLTAKEDINALGEIMQSYMRHDIGHYIDALPDRPGTGLMLDDNSERVFPIQMRPRRSWHAGGTPDAFDE